jgi:hypothetical protein
MGEGNPPPELVLAWDVKRWGVLPDQGGIRDQRLGDLNRMRAALNAYNVMRDFRDTKLTWVEWMAQNPEGGRLVREVVKAQKAAKEVADA